MALYFVFNFPSNKKVDACKDRELTAILAHNRPRPDPQASGKESKTTGLHDYGACA